MADNKTAGQNDAMWNSLASMLNSGSSMFQTGMQYGTMLNGNARDAQVQIAQYNAQAAQANAGNNDTPKQTFGVDNKYIFIGGIALVGMILAIVFMKRRKTTA
ncbi:MAG TPA: hypothetical protein PLP27_10930 [Crocinitomicaceae bacterium]|nr:hypothetical protein [Crocinitomicaceae bacterium]